MKKVLLFVFVVFCTLLGKSQIAYLATNGQNVTGTYTDLGSNGTAITINFSGAAMTFDNDNSVVQNIGFNFEFNSTIFTQFVLNTNGFIKLGNAAPSSTTIFYDATSSTYGGCINAMDSNLIYPFNHDLQGAISPEYRVYTNGSSPNRICTIQYKNVKDKMNTGGSDLQYANMNFQIKLYEGTNNVEFVYSSFTATANPSVFKTAAVGLKASNADNSINVAKSSSGSWATAVFQNGNYGGNFFNNRNATLPDVGRTYRFQAFLSHDMAVRNVWTQSKVATSLSNPLVIMTNVGNAGNTTLRDKTVTLTVTGANSFTNTKNITSPLSPGLYPIISFDGFNPINPGTNIITVTVDNDDVNTNSSMTVQQEVTADKMSYIFNGTADGGYNFTNQQSGDMVAKFKTGSSTTINQVKVSFTNAGVPCQAVIWDATGILGRPATILWQSPIVTSVAGIMTFNVNPLVTVNGNFHVGARLPNGGLCGIAYENENPVRQNTFFWATPTGGNSWGDVSNYGETYRPMIEVQFGGLIVPLKIIDFSARDNGNNILLSWSTANEVNNKNFEIQRSLNGTDFITIGSVNPNSAYKYNFTDINIASATNTFYYRLKQNDKDGSFNYSSIAKVNRKAGNGFIATAINPAKDNIVLQLQSNRERKVQINVMNDIGQVMLKQTLSIMQGSSSITIDGSNGLSKGNYFVQLSFGDEKQTIKVMKQ
jgi:hypothetical protein